MRRRNFIAGLLAAPLGVFASKFMPTAREPIVHWEGTRIPLSGVMRAEIGTVNLAAFAEVEALEKRVQRLSGAIKMGRWSDDLASMQTELLKQSRIRSEIDKSLEEFYRSET